MAVRDLCRHDNLERVRAQEAHQSVQVLRCHLVGVPAVMIDELQAYETPEIGGALADLRELPPPQVLPVVAQEAVVVTAVAVEVSPSARAQVAIATTVFQMSAIISGRSRCTGSASRWKQ